MIRLALMVPALLLPILVQSCGIGLGDLDQYAINYKISVYNGGDTTAAIHIFLAQTARDATVPPNGSVEFVGFKGGTWTVNMVSAASRLTVLQARSKALTTALDAMKNPSDRTVENINNDLDDLDEAILHADSGPNSGSCSGEMNDPGGDVLNITVTNRDLTNEGSTVWTCRGQ